MQTGNIKKTRRISTVNGLLPPCIAERQVWEQVVSAQVDFGAEKSGRLGPGDVSRNDLLPRQVSTSRNARRTLPSPTV